ncbi:MAG: tRNA preQ1(34) S-adenosylmethionine ribosyltransferase-isomerase QueA [Alphaproteobacteria bacterium CG11_big_fil_rev_8_21_14_0_20_44_7]|nr:MAG: tRNA preQ1(34) S-adenosylmethionine ribosyltransferase-isomerase QueA [Alphaproteobacteria bacterium CG11_big_fil_rev_8_21_14_0_20_44_7]
MRLSDFDFELPPQFIANEPANPRDSSKLLVIGEKFEDKIFRDLPSLISADDLLVFNNSKVIPARLFATPLTPHLKAGKEGGKLFEILLLRKQSENIWNAFIKGSKRLKENDTLNVRHPALVAESGYVTSVEESKNRIAQQMRDDELTVTVKKKSINGEIKIELSDESLIEEYGHMPLPPYIKREDNAADKTTYQTVYAEHKGSVAAPTAGLHFTEDLLSKIPNKAFVTLHVGAGTFQPVKTEDITEHKMHSEWYEIDEETAERIRNCKGRVIAVGTTSARVLEASGGKAGCGDTEIFIYPGYKFKVVDALITNFHLPKSSLFMLVCALAGIDKMQAAYEHAKKNDYRFYSYGDGCFICP